ncbi:hypothetical protein AN643_00240 [Candidatus Epulonipiscioides saccharophilum]|nr:hypothetical protein AN643_00240 [Epulopiscium sp. SCG-B10WGA-EpuloB]
MKTLADRWDSTSKMNIARLIKEQGYQTALFGKWHLFDIPRGFDEYKYLGGPGQMQGAYVNPMFFEKGKDGLVQYEGYVSDIITDMTLDWLKKREEDKPFFIMCNHRAPHDMWQYAERFEHMFDGVEIPEPDSLFEDLSHRSAGSYGYGSTVSPRSMADPKTPHVKSLYKFFMADDYVTGKLDCDENATFEEKAHKAYQKYLKDYLRTVAGIDDSVKNLLDYLETTGELDNTVIIYTSDQGMYLGEHDYCDKRWSYEEGIRTPFLIRYPKEIKAGTVSSELVSNIDVAPLLLDFAGGQTPEEMQGRSFRKIIKGEEHGYDAVYFRYWMHLAHHEIPSHYGIRTKDYKLIYYYGRALGSKGAINIETPQAWELYDLKNDPLELNNLYEKERYSTLVKDLKAKLLELKIKYQDTDEQFPELLPLAD